MRRISEDTIQAWKAQLNRMSSEVVRLQELLEKYDGDFWESYSGKLKERINDLSEARKDYMRMSEVELKCNLAKEEILNIAVNMPLDAKEALENAIKSKEKLRAQIRNAEKND